jgi:protein tyrosine/serine phosphatase
MSFAPARASRGMQFANYITEPHVRGNRPERIIQHIVILWLLIVSPVMRAGTESSKIQVKNFARVNDTYYRGAQPTPQDYAELVKLGIKTVIDLKHDDASAESNLVQRAGMKFYSIPMTTTSTPSDSAVTRFLKLVNDPANQPVFVHCHGGHDRTGVMTAIYRMTHDGWTAEHAYAEMKRYGYQTERAGPVLKEFLFEFARRFRSAIVPR